MTPLQKVEQLIKEHQGIRLDIGCGKHKQPGFVGLDYRDWPGVDIVWDVEEFPWPLPDECVLVAIASHVVEHINPHGGVFLKFMDEVWRIMKPGGEFAIAAPHGSSQGFLQDPTHCNALNENSFWYFTPEHPLYSYYEPKPWKLKYRAWSPNANIEVVLIKLDGQDPDNGTGTIWDDLSDAAAYEIGV